MPCGAHGTANRSLRPCEASFFSTAGFWASQSFFACSNEVARNGTTSRPKIGSSFSCSEISTSPICAWPVCTARLMSGALNSEALGWTAIWSLPPVASATSLAKRTRFSECGLSAG
jgi:hypothetical protein